MKKILATPEAFELAKKYGFSNTKTRPTGACLQSWLRNNFDIHVNLRRSYALKKKEYFYAYEIDCWVIYGSGKRYKTYEEALLEGLEFILKKYDERIRTGEKVL
jgi:hypothetical protein